MSFNKSPVTDETIEAFETARTEATKTLVRCLDQAELSNLPVSTRYAVLITAQLDALFSVCFADLDAISHPHIRSLILKNMEQAEQAAKLRVLNAELTIQDNSARYH